MQMGIADMAENNVAAGKHLVQSSAIKRQHFAILRDGHGAVRGHLQAAIAACGVIHQFGQRVAK